MQNLPGIGRRRSPRDATALPPATGRDALWQYQTTPPNYESIEWTCPNCGSAMWITRIGSDVDTRAFEGSVCDISETAIMDIIDRLRWCPLYCWAWDVGGWHLARNEALCHRLIKLCDKHERLVGEQSNQNNQNQDNEGTNRTRVVSRVASSSSSRGAEQARSAVGWAKARSARWPATLVFNTKGPALPGLSLCVEVHFRRLGGFRFHINNAFRDLG